MAAGFSVTISAVDTATKTIDNVNRRLAGMRAPTERLQKSLSQFGKLSGVTQVAAGFEKMGRGAFNAFQSVARVVAPLSAITGAASIAGMYRLIEAWGQWGSQLGFAATRIGITAGQLQTLQGASLLAGGSVQGMQQGLQSLGQTMYDAIGGRAPEAVVLMNQLGIAFDDGTRHARSVTAVLPEIADKIAAIKDPYTQARIAAGLFGGAAEEMLPFLRRGSAGIADLEAKSKRYGVTSEAGVAAANRMREAQASLTLAVGGLTNSIAERLAPVLSPLLLQMADWIAANRDWIATDVGKYVQQLADWVKQVDFSAIVHDVQAFAVQANGVAQSLGGWKSVLEGIIAIKIAAWASGAIGPVSGLIRLLALIPGSGVAAGALGSVALPAIGAAAVAVPLAYGLSKAVGYDPSRDKSRANMRAGTRGAYMGPRHGAAADEVTASQKQALTFFQSAAGGGWSAAQAAGLVANFRSESSLDPTAVGDGGQAYGIGQWHADRQAAFERQFGHKMQGSSLAEQLAFSNYELTAGGEQSAGGRLRNASDPYSAGATVSQFYERPAAVEDAARNRGNLATSIAGAPPVSLADGSAGAAGANGKVDVTIRTAGPGVQQVSAKSTGNVNPPKIASNNVGIGSGGT